MGKGLKSLLTLGLLGGAAFGGYKGLQQYEYLNESYNNLILFRGEKLVYDEVFEGDAIAAVATGVEIDLRDAEFDADFTNLDLYGMGAGIKVLVPNNVHVIATGVNKGSGVHVDVEDSAGTKVLNITYDLTASGLMITSVKSSKDQPCDSDPMAEMAEVDDQEGPIAEMEDFKQDLEEGLDESLEDSLEEVLDASEASLDKPMD